MRILIDALKTFSICLVFLAMASIASASSIDQLQPASSAGKPASDIEYTDTVIFPSIKVGAQGVGGVTFFNGTIVNATTGDNDVDNPVTFGDNVRIDGRVYRGATAGPDDDMSFTINDNLEVLGTIQGSNLIGVGQLSISNTGSSGQVLSLNADGVLEWTDDATGSGSSGSSGDITAVTAGSGLGGGGTSGDVSLSVSGVTSSMITDGTIVVGDIANNAITSAKILDGVVSSADIANSTIIAGDLASNAVTSVKILDGTVASADIANDTVDFDKIVDSPNLDADLNIESNTLFVGNTGGSYAGRIGIGTATPNTTIQVADYINFDNTSDLRLTALGYQAGNTLGATGYRNTLVGYQAGDVMTSGTDNTAIGNSALGATTTTANNTAVGSGALAANTDTNNTAVGKDALTTQTTGNGNTAVGSEALDANTIGDYNTAIGNDALGTNIEASSNTAIGYNAMAANNGTGNMNVAVGRNALDASTNGTWNVAVGYGTLTNGTGVDSSTAVGHLALTAATGDNNVGIGYQAGNGITSGANNIAIGYDADVPFVDASNQLNIGNAIWGDLTNDYIAIGGTETPTDVMLEINQSGTVPHISLNPVADAPVTGNSTGDIYMDTDGSLYVYNTVTWAAANAGSDFSELIVPLGFEKEVPDGTRTYVGDINAGDIVVINENGDYERSTIPNDPMIVGAESAERGRFRLKEGSQERAEGQRQVGIVGHIIVNVSAENGSIHPGDPLTTSSTPGHAMKATEPGVIVGRALEVFDGSQGETGKIEVIINPGWNGGI